MKPEPLRSLELLQGAVELYRRHPVAQGRHLCLHPGAQDIAVVGDRTLLSRVLCNLLKNALEACRSGETVTAGCAQLDGQVEFHVHNPGVIPRDVQLQIFQRSFSTKGAGRGVGTYSIKLLTERYLHGRVSFTSTPEQGTTFQVRYPLVQSQPRRALHARQRSANSRRPRRVRLILVGVAGGSLKAGRPWGWSDAHRPQVRAGHPQSRRL